ncbi:hypothetical protein BKA63DRAFT_485605 [Paraphoma chrysanthemicola]|nr:hypothetical protein BKA63DRAFT_485605 [Paraphoma chrysanthemicola]
MDLHLACTRSQYMAMMVRCRKKDSDNSPIRVFAHPETFREYKHYILHGFPLQPRAFMPSAARGTAAAAQLPTKADKRSIRDEYEKLAQLYVLAIYPLDFSMKNTLIGAMGCAAHALQANGKPWFPEREAINIIFAGTDESDKMRSLLVTLLVDFGQGDWLPKGKQAHLQYNDDCIYSCLCGTLSQRYMSPRLRSLSLSYDTADFLIGRMRTVHSTRSIGAQGVIVDDFHGEVSFSCAHG